jgi:RNA polymerase sigma-70 factor (ECF subfamily)
MTSPGDLAAAFLARAPASSAARTLANLEQELCARLEAGRAAWPDFDVEPFRFVTHIAERAGEGLPALDLASDLYLACACALQIASALEAFQRAFRGDVGRAISRTDPSAAFLDEVMQILSVKLFVRTGAEAPAIAQYSGRASLRGWVVTVAKRTALNLRRAKGDQAHEQVPSAIQQLGTAAGPELALLKARYKVEFEAAIREGLASLNDKERSLILLHLVHGVTLPQLAAMQNVSRTTVARWLATARETMFAAARQSLESRLDVSTSEYESLLGLVRSQLDVSIVDMVQAPFAASTAK